MDIENQLASLEPSKKLKELGVKQESIHYWGRYLHHCEGDFELSDRYSFENCNAEYYSAFTVAESIEALPGTISMTGNFPYYLKIEKIVGMSGIKNYRVTYCCMEVNSDDLCCVEDNKLVDALARIRIYLIENELI